MASNTEDKKAKKLFDFVPTAKPRLYLNIGCGMDILTGSFVTGMKGETITNGGLGPVTGIAGKGNYFKSTFCHYLSLRAANVLREGGLGGELMLYDTEMNINYEGLTRLANNHDEFAGDPIADGEWVVTDKSQIAGNVWFEKLSDVLEEKKKNKEHEVTYECFKDHFTKKALVGLDPSIITIDSFSDFDSENTVKRLSGDLDDSSTKTYAMEQGAFKTKLLSRLPVIGSATNTYFLLTAQMGGKIDMSGPSYGNVPVKDLQHLNSDLQLKGVSSKFYFLTTQCYQAQSCSTLTSPSKEPEYPLDSDDVTRYDLNLVKFKILRNKNGPSGEMVEVIISQTEGVLPDLTEFHYIKERGRFGLVGNNTHYALAIYPDCKISRTTVRSKLNNDPLLRRAVNITAELLQIKLYKTNVVREGLWCTPEELYEDIKKLGYDWNVLLNTRGYWLPNQYHTEVPFLSTMDLLRMRKGLYHPYFLPKKEK